MFLQTTILAILYLGLTACVTLQRSPESGYRSDSKEISVSPTKEHYQEQRQLEITAAKEELGVPTSRPLTESEKRNVHNRIQLNRLEASLITPVERRQYYHLKPFFKNDSYRIYFLKLPSIAARKDWAQRKNITANNTEPPQAVIDAIENSDITLGMTKEAVVQSWGDPDNVEVAGNRLYGNERWNYLKYASSEEGYKKETRVIVFEAGRVSGWERY